ncbi:MAG: DUF6775 family putative metallopeptidase [Candidatus Nitrosotenuis sp.]
MKISKIFLYDEPSVPEINLDRLAQFLERTFKIKVEKRKNIFFEAHLSVARELASIRVFNFHKPFETHVPTEEEIKFEMESLTNTEKTQDIVLYDGFEFQRITNSLIPKDELSLENFHIVFTNKLTCTFDLTDYRYHGRALIGSNPSVISTTGIIEAPAKPRQYYLDLMTNYGQSLNIESIKKKYQGTYLEYHDHRLGRIVEGYCLQALFYYLSGEPFCELLDCRLHNAHWQHDLLYSQIEYGKLCQRHKSILDKWLT